MLLPFVPLLDDRPRPTTPYEFSWALHPSVIIGTGLLGALYFWGIGPLRRRKGLGPPAAPWQVASFSAALVVLLVSLNGPIHDLSDYYLFSIHMVQHLVLTLLFPPLLIAGIPGWLLSPLLRREGVRRVARVLAHPVVAAAVYTATIAAWHVAAAYDLMMRNHDVHIATHIMFMVTATMMWWPVMSPSPGGPATVARARNALSLSGRYSDAAHRRADHAGRQRSLSLVLGRAENVGAVAARRSAARRLLMWVPGNLWIFLAIGVLFFKWAHESE